jgi:hypothetical protein
MPTLASNAAHNAVSSTLTAKGQAGARDDRPGLPPLTISERLLVVVVMVGAWAGMILLSILRD